MAGPIKPLDGAVALAEVRAWLAPSSRSTALLRWRKSGHGWAHQAARRRCCIDRPDLRHGDWRDEITPTPPPRPGPEVSLRRVPLPSRSHHAAVLVFGFGLSYRDAEELLAERGIEVDHVTVYRWSSGSRRSSPRQLGPAGTWSEIGGASMRPTSSSEGPGAIPVPGHRSVRPGHRRLPLTSPGRQCGEAVLRPGLVGPGSHPWRSPPTGTASTPGSSTRCSRRPSMKRRSTPTIPSRPTTDG
jgi:hypothetical protein